MKLKRLFATTLAILATSPLLADTCNTCDPCDQVDTCNDCTPSFLCGCICDWCDWENGWTVQADWLYWKVRRCDLDYAIKGAYDASANLDGTIRCVDPSRDGGFRVAMFKDCGDCWRFGFRYTSFETDEHASLHTASASSNFVPTRLTGETLEDFGSELLSADAVYKFNLDIVDVESSYVYRFDCSDATLRPFTGLRFAFIDQDLNTKYDNDKTNSNWVNKVDAYDVLTMDAYGLMFGLEGEWDDVWCGVGLYGRCASCLSVAEFEASHLEINVTLPSPTRQIDTKKRQYLVVPSWDMAVGLEYELCPFLCASWDVKLGYEIHSWCNLPDFLNFPSGSREGINTRTKSDLSYEGLFLRLTGTF